MSSTQPPIPDLLVLMAHGSRDPRWRQPFEALVSRLPHRTVALCYMEMAEPTLAQVIDQFRPTQSVTILPLFMAAGAHVANDIAALADSLKVEHPSLTVSILPPVGEHSEVQAALLSVIQPHLPVKL
jgi:sirohydrochlorin cobaltochelatase